MKKCVLTIFLFGFSLLLWAQKSKSLKNQKIIFEEAQKSTAKLDYASAIGFYTYAYNLNPKNDLGKKAKIKSDSLKALPRKKYVESIIGKWKLKRFGSNWGMENYKDSINNQILVIERDKFIFFEQNIATKELRLLKSEDLKFLTSLDEENYTNEFLFSDNQIWWFGMAKNSSELLQFKTGEKTINGRTDLYCGNSELYYTKIED